MDGMVRDGSLLCTTGVGRGDAGGRRRRFSATRKAAIVAESFVAGTKVSEVAARHGLQASLLSTWRRLAMPVEQRCRTGRAIEPSPTTLDFVPVTVSTERLSVLSSDFLERRRLSVCARPLVARPDPG